MTAHLQHPFHLNSAVATTSPNNSSPTTPTYPDHHRRPPTPQHSQTHTLDEVRIWTEDQVIEWLRDVGFGSHERAFADNSINGELLLEIDHQALKQLEIPTVGERVKILSAVKQLRRDCLGSPAPKYSKDRPILVLPTWDSRATAISPSSSSLPHNSFLSALASSHGHTLPSYQQSQLQPESTRSDPNDKYSAALKSSPQLPPGAVQRSSSFTRILGRNESKKGTIRIGNGKGDEKDREKSGEQGISYTPTSPNITGHQRRNSFEGPSISAGIMSYDKIKQQYVRVFGEDGQHRIVEVLSTPDVRTIMSKVLHKFGIENEDVSKYSIFVGSSDTGAARALTDEELLEICHSADRPEKERLILRKKHLFVTHEEFKRKGTNTHRLRKLQNFFGDGPVPSSLGPGNAVAAALAQNGMGMPGLGFVGFNGSSSSLQPPAIVSPLAHSQPQQLYFQFNGSQPDKQQTLQIITSTYPASPSASTHAGSASPNYFSRHSPFSSSSGSGSWANTFSPHRQGPNTPVATRPVSSSKGPRLRQFFGERPPSEIISSNLQSFFPNHKPDVLETAGINAQRMSLRRGSSVSSRSLLVMPGSNVGARNPNRRSVYRDSVLPELVQTLGLELDKVSEDGDEDVVHHQSKETDAEITERDLDLDDRMDTDSEQSEMVETQRVMAAEDEVEVRLEIRTEDAEANAEANAKAVLQKTNGTVLAVDIVVEEEGATLVAITASDDDKVVVVEEEEEDEERKDTDSVVDDSLEEAAEEEEEEEEEIADDAPIIQWMKGSLIGRGTFGDVYLGLNPLTGELMAVKQVELPVVNSATEDRKQSMVDALQREIALLKVLQHENIVQYLGSQSDEAHLNIFLEYVPGGSVAGLLASYGAFQEPLVRSFVKQILRGLCYLHQRDIIHRDIKGANILVDNKGGVKISDFGISKKVEDDMLSATNTGPHRPSLQGSVFWMAPEVVKQTQYTFKADIWSLGCLVVEMFTGDHPFPEYSQMQAMFKIGTSSSPAIPENISEEAKDFLRKTFEPEFQERPSAEMLLLHPFIDSEGTFVPVVPGNMSTNTLVGF